MVLLVVFDVLDQAFLVLLRMRERTVSGLPAGKPGKDSCLF